MLLSGNFGLYLFSFSDFDMKIQEGEQIEAKTTLDDIYMDVTSQINAKKICHWSKVCHVTSLTLDFIGSTQIKTVHD